MVDTRRGGGLFAALAWLAFPAVPVVLEGAYNEAAGLARLVSADRGQPDPGPVLARVPDLAPRGVEVGDVGLSSGVDRERALDPYRPQGVGALQGEGNPARGRRLLGGFSARDRSKGKQEKGQSRGRDGTECARGHADSGKSQAQRWLGLYSREPG